MADDEDLEEGGVTQCELDAWDRPFAVRRPPPNAVLDVGHNLRPHSCTSEFPFLRTTK
jgi:hypothetical protein